MRSVLMILAMLFGLASTATAADFFSQRSGNTTYLYQYGGGGYSGYGQTYGGTTYYHFNSGSSVSSRLQPTTNYGSGWSYGSNSIGYQTRPSTGYIWRR